MTEEEHPEGTSPSNLYDDLRLHSILDELPFGLCLVDRERRITFWSCVAEAITGVPPSEAVGRRCHDDLLIHTDNARHRLCLEGCPLLSTLADGKVRDCEGYLHHRSGHQIPVDIRIVPFLGKDGRVSGAAQIFRDRSEHVQALEQIEELKALVLLDDLTRLGNRRYAKMCLSDRLAELERYGWGFGLLFIDIDDLKTFNDRFGHEVGDEVLRVVSKTLLSNTRSMDFIGRWGGDEFVAVVVNVDGDRLNEVANRFRLLVADSSVRKDSRDLRATISVGATLARAGDTPDALVARADRLLYEGKRAGKNRVTTDTAVAPSRDPPLTDVPAAWPRDP